MTLGVLSSAIVEAPRTYAAECPLDPAKRERRSEASRRGWETKRSGQMQQGAENGPSGPQDGS